MTKGLGGKQEGSSRFPEQVKLTSKRKTKLCSIETVLQNAPNLSSLEKYFTILLARMSTSRSILQFFGNLIYLKLNENIVFMSCFPIAKLGRKAFHERNPSREGCF